MRINAYSSVLSIPSNIKLCEQKLRKDYELLGRLGVRAIAILEYQAFQNPAETRAKNTQLSWNNLCVKYSVTIHHH
jgi:hypothetical protein